MKMKIVMAIALVTMVAGQVPLSATAEAGGHGRYAGPGYGGGHFKGYKRHGHYRGYRRHGYKHRGYKYRGFKHGGYKHGGYKHGGYRHWGHGYGYYGSHKYDYLLGGLILGATATYLFTQPRYVERQTIVYKNATVPAVNPSLGSVLEYNRTGQSSAWRNPDTGQTVVAEPVRTHQTSAGPCREYVTTITIGGQQQRAYGTACRQSDGSWRLTR